MMQMAQQLHSLGMIEAVSIKSGEPRVLQNHNSQIENLVARTMNIIMPYLNLELSDGTLNRLQLELGTLFRSYRQSIRGAKTKLEQGAESEATEKI